MTEKEQQLRRFLAWLDREIDKATDDWVEAESDSHPSGYFDALREVHHQLRLCGLSGESGNAR